MKQSQLEREFYSRLGVNLRTVRERVQLKQRSVAHSLSVAPSEYCRWESGESRMVARDLLKLTYMFGVPVRVLFDGTREIAEQARLARAEI
jgi:transcriptional regulator with XRE-family HTH domain